MSSSNTPFPLGVYVGGPNGSDASVSGAIDSLYSNFDSVMGASPQFGDAYVNQAEPIDHWAASASWAAWSWAQDANTKSATPVIGMPMSSSVMGLSNDQFYKNFASGQYDGAISGMVKSWADQGYTTQYWRPGWEMNLSGMPSYVGDDAQTKADWTSAFQHISGVLHSAGSQDGVNVQVVWNPNVQNWSPTNPLTLYPGSQSVDVIAGDFYDNVYPYSLANLGKGDGSTAGSISDWDSNAANLVSYYNNPAATQWSSDGSGGHSMSLQNLIDFARQQGKPIAIGETGAGGSGTAGMSDDATFPQWLATTLANSGVPVSFVNIWDVNYDGNWNFSDPGAGKPAEAAAWAKYFGAGSGTSSTPTTSAPATSAPATSAPATSTTPPSTVGTAPATPSIPAASGSIILGDDAAHTYTLDTALAQTVGSGPDSLTVYISEDAWQGDAQFAIDVNGQPIGGTLTATANHGAGETQAVTLQGNFSGQANRVSVGFLNDAYGGTASADRNLHIDGLGVDGATIDTAAAQNSNGVAWFLAPAVQMAPAGDASLTASASANLFDFSGGAFGADTVAGFDASHDLLKFGAAQAGNYQTVLSDTSTVSGGTLIQLDGSHSVLLQGVVASTLTSANFAFA